METVIANLKDNLINLIKKRGFSINKNSLDILVSAEEQCYQRNITFFAPDLLLPIIKKFPDFSGIINKYGGNTISAIEVLEKLLDNARDFKERDNYDVINYSVEEWDNYRFLIIDKCMKHAKKNNRFEINEADIILSVLDIHDEEFPLYDNSTFTDVRFHTPFNTLSHIVGNYSEYLWVKNDDIRWELSNSNKKNYDIAISFSGKDRKIAEEIAKMLSDSGKRVFYDNFERANLWGKDLYTYLSEIYGERAKYCLMMVSQNYVKEHWPNLERQAAQAKAFREQHEYILPLRLDDTEIPGLLPTTGYIDIRNTNISEIVNLIIDKISYKVQNEIKK